jgi:lysophospholipase L1-like esterase
MRRQPGVPGVPLRTGPRSWRRYVAIGDSLSEGLGDPVPGGGTRGWATLLAADLRRQQPDLSFTNLAVRGYMVRHAIDRQLEPALTARPDLVSIFIGGNDALLRPQLDGDRFGADLDRLVAPLAHSGATLVLSTLPDLTACSPLPPPWRGILRRRILAVNEHIRRVATVHDTVLLDAWLDARTRRHRMWSIDRIHPSAEGHRLIAASVATLLGLPVDDEAQAFVPAGIGADLLRHAREGRWLVRHGFRRGTAGARRGTADLSPLPAEPSGELHRR